MDKEKIILVDEHDRETGIFDKLEAHRKGLLHRAFSVFIINSKGEHLLQKRATHKYHSPGLWSNACCSHHIAGTDFTVYINRRLNEEIGLSDQTITKLFSTIYKLDCGNKLIEHEYDHVFIGRTDDQPHPNPSEVAELKYLSAGEIDDLLSSQPEIFTEWFKLLYPKVIEKLALDHSIPG
ncbi:MAG: isopentenyl-diphosphate Delta-isomerase [Cyclobacteriaceae bacterium]